MVADSSRGWVGLSGTTSPLLRRMNAHAVLDALLAAGALSGADLMASTQLSRPTVHAVCDELIARGWLTELEPMRPTDASRPGRRARRYAARADAGHVLGVDMGATSVRAAVADLRGAVLGETRTAFRHDRVPAAERLEVTRAAAATALDAAGIGATRVLGGAIGVPAPVTAGGQVVVEEDFLPGIAALDLRTALAPVTNLPLLVGNDANLAVLAERWIGVAAGADDVVLVLAGERLGAGICVGGRIVHGHRGGAGELGFLDLVAGVGDTDGIGNLARRWGSEAVGRPVRAEQVFDAARRGESWAREVLDAVARRTARTLAVLASLLDPEVIVVGGAVADSGEHLLVPLKQEFARVSRRPARLAASTLADRGVLLGAVRAALDDVRPRLLDLVPA